ncbi:MAG: hypothetical protein ACYTFQ_13130, partial [Planctomycetota bacterium]
GAGRVALDRALETTSPVKLGVVNLWPDEEDGHLNPDETVHLWPCLKNFGVSQPGVSVHAQTTDPYITLLDDFSYVGDIDEKQNVVAQDDGMTICIDDDTPEDHIASISLEISTAEHGLVATDELRMHLNPGLSEPFTVAHHPQNFDYIRPKLAVLPNNALAVVYRSNSFADNQLYARIAHRLDAWDPIVKISEAPGIKAARGHSVAVSDNGWLHVCFLGVVGSWEAEIFYTAWNPNDRLWIDPVQVTTSAEIFDRDIPGWDSPITIGIDLQGHPHIVWVDYRRDLTADFYHIRHDGNNWSPEKVIAIPPDNASNILQPHLIFDSRGTGYLIWGQVDEDSIYMTQLTGNHWSSPELTTTTSVNTAFTLALDSQDQLHLAYFAPWHDELVYQLYDGNKWSDIEMLTDKSVFGRNPVIVIDPDDRLRVARMSRPHYPLGQWQIYEWIHDGMSWSTMTPVTFTRAGIPLHNLDYVIDKSGTRLLVGQVDTIPSGDALFNADTDIVLFTSNPDPAWYPSRPVVVDGGLITTNRNALEASWSSTHVSGIAEYEYGIGTFPGEADLRYWKSAGTQTTVVEDLTDTPLIPAQSYYISVRARSATGYWSPFGASDGIVYLPGINGNKGVN